MGEKSAAQALVLMGVSGVGKTTIGRRLAARLGWLFVEGDEYHPPENVVKMAAGQPLTDADRRPWLAQLQTRIAEELGREQSLVLACSALKAAYRQQLRAGHQDQLRFIYLEGEIDTIRMRLESRRGHYMPPELLRSQLEDLEIPSEALHVTSNQPIDSVLDEIVSNLG